MSVITPRFSQSDVFDGVNGYPVPISQTTVRIAAGTDFSGSGNGQLGAVSTPDVFCPRHWFQMVRVDASFYATQVVELQTFGNRTNELLVGNDVSNSRSLPGSDLPVVGVLSVSPDPDPAGSRETPVLDEVVGLGNRSAFAARTADTYSLRHWVTSFGEVALRGWRTLNPLAPSYLANDPKEVY